jgi:putative NIF3 family GTP cyclohydrolase 1 type 2
MQNGPTGWAVELLLNEAFGNPMTTARYEGLCAGDPHIATTGAVVCYAPTVQMLKRAPAEGKNLFLCREHPYYLHGGLNYPYTTDGLEEALKGDPVVAAKRKLIADANLTIYRFGAKWDEFRPQAQSAALARALGFKVADAASCMRVRGVVCTLTEKTTMTALAQRAATRLSCTAPRIVGDMQAQVTRVAVLAGETDPKEALGRLLADPAIDGLVAGAGGTIDEVDGAIAYFRDLIASGRKIALLAVGYGPSEDPGVGEMAVWMQGVLPDVKIDWWRFTDPSWIPAQRAA